MANVSGESGGNRGVYSIGAVARMLDVPAATIRNWEERYATVVPERSEGDTGFTPATRWTIFASSRRRFRAGFRRPTLTGCSRSSARLASLR